MKGPKCKLCSEEHFWHQGCKARPMGLAVVVEKIAVVKPVKHKPKKKTRKRA